MAMHRVLMIPEILDHIFIQLLPSPEQKSEHAIKSTIRDLQSCACVNQAWNCIATRHLWHNPCYLKSDNIATALSRVGNRYRRQFCASNIKEGSLFTFSPHPRCSFGRDLSESESESILTTFSKTKTDASVISVLEELDFPKLQSVTIVAGYHASIIPPLKSHSVRKLVIDAQHWLYNGIFVNMAEVDCILEQIPSQGPPTPITTITKVETTR
ncbi:hypothetical protein KEM54_003114 [Ascosphaera aggregata]|nr:hypothetical protein KEM54_003114 [Ascosphaera aggregata]